MDNPVGIVEILERSRPDLVLMDVNLPAIAGSRRTELVRRSGRQRCPSDLLEGATGDEVAELLREFIDEAMALAESVSGFLLLFLEKAWQDGGPSEAMRKETLRALYTLKGNAAMLGHDRIEAVALALEDTLVQADDPALRTRAVYRGLDRGQ